MAVEGNARGRGTGARRSERDTEDGVGSEPRLVLGSIELDQGGVEHPLLGQCRSDERVAQLAGDVRNGAEHAEAAEARATVTQFGCFCSTCRAPRGNIGRTDHTTLQLEIDLHRGQPAAVEHLTGSYVLDRQVAHTTTSVPVSSRQARVRFSAASVRWALKRSSLRSASPERIAAINSSCSAATSAGRS